MLLYKLTLINNVYYQLAEHGYAYASPSFALHRFNKYLIHSFSNIILLTEMSDLF